jgi:hypothetical protein
LLRLLIDRTPTSPLVERSPAMSASSVSPPASVSALPSIPAPSDTAPVGVA